VFLEKIFDIKDKSYLNSLSQAGSIGLHMVSGVAVGTLIGYALDAWLESSPWCTGIFAAVGIAAGFKNVYVDTRRLVKTQQEEDEKRASSRNGNKNA
jgi:ATP synthase protein I